MASNTLHNTQVTIAGGNVSFSQSDQNSTAVPVAQAHNVQVSSISPSAVFSANSEHKSGNASSVFSPPEHKSSAAQRASISSINAAHSSAPQQNPSWAETEDDEPMFQAHDEPNDNGTLQEKIPTPTHPFTALVFHPYPHAMESLRMTPKAR